MGGVCGWGVGDAGSGGDGDLMGWGFLSFSMFETLLEHV